MLKLNKTSRLTVERLPPTEFGRTLRTLIREQWKTQASFAEAAGVDETWVSSVIRGRQEHLTYAGLQALLAGFQAANLKDQLYEAWLSTYAPLPSGRETPDVWSSDREIVSFARSVHELISGGRALETFKTLGRLWQSLKHDPERRAATLAAGRAFVEAAQQLDRIAVALQVCDELVGLARPSMEPADLTRALWLRGVSLRLVRPRVVVAAESAFGDLIGHLEDWQPRSAEEREIHREFTHVAMRDRVLSALDLVRAGQAEADVLMPRVRVLVERSKELEDAAWVGLAGEVAARGLIAAGRPDEAGGLLRQAARCATTKVNELKVLVSEIQLLMATGQRREAEGRLGVALDLADGYCLVHHRQKLAGIQRRLEAPTAARSFSVK